MQPAIRCTYGIELRATARALSPLDIRCSFMLASLLKIEDEDDFNAIGIDVVTDWCVAAYLLGTSADIEDEPPALFVGTELAAQWETGQKDRFQADTDARSGSQEEWDKLSEEEQSDQWDSFHDLCARGIGDEHAFYDLLMSRWMVGYVGH